MKRILFLAILCLIAIPSYATTFYTSSTGSDTANNCQNIASPCNLSNGLANEMSQITAAHADVLYMCAGACDGAGSATVAIFLNDQTITVPSGSSYANALTVLPYPGETITWQPTSCEFVLGIQGAAYTIFQSSSTLGTPNFILDAVNCALIPYIPPVGPMLMGGDGLEVGHAGASHNRFINIDIKNALFNGVLVADDPTISPNNELIAIRSHDNGTAGYGHAIYVCASNTLVDGMGVGETYNEIGNPSVGTHNVFGVQVYCANMTGANNDIVRNMKIHDNSNGMIIGTGSGNLAYNNSLYGNVGRTAPGTIYILSGSGVGVYNNTVYNTGSMYGTVCAVAQDAGSGNFVQNNIFWMNPTDGVCVNGGSLTQSNNTSTNPLFSDAGSGNFHLLAGSPALGAGLNFSLTFTTDASGAMRPAMGAWDNGPYIGSSAPPNNPSPTEFFAYSNGVDLDTQNGGTNWTTAWSKIGMSAVVIGAGPAGSGSGGNAAESNSGGGVLSASYERYFAQMTAGSIEWYWYVTSCSPSSGAMYTILRLDEVDSMLVKITGGNFQIWDNSIPGYTTVGSCTANMWQIVELNFDAIVHPNQYRFRLNGGSYSSYATVSGGSLSSVDEFQIYDSSVDSHTTWWDDIMGLVPCNMTALGSGWTCIIAGAASSVNDNTVATNALNMTGADLIVAVLGIDKSFTTPTLTDTSSNTWHGLTKKVSTNAATRILYCSPCTVSSSQVFSVSQTGTFPSICIAGFSGSRSTPFDHENGATGSAVTTIATGSITPSLNSSLVISGGGFDDTGGGISVGSGLMVSNTSPSGADSYGCSLGYLMQNVATSINPTWDLGGVSQNPAVVIADFLAAAGNSTRRLTLLGAGK